MNKNSKNAVIGLALMTVVLLGSAAIAVSLIFCWGPTWLRALEVLMLTTYTVPALLVQVVHQFPVEGGRDV